MKRKSIIFFIIITLLLVGAAGTIFVCFKYPEKIKRIVNGIFASEGKIEGLQEQDSLDWKEIKISELNNNVNINQSLMLINTENTLSKDFIPDVSEYKNSGVVMNNCIQEAYASLAAQVYEQFGQKLYVRSAYRSAEEQQQQIEDNGEKATSLGASEHQAGLALDVYVQYYAGAGFIDCEAGRWVNQYCGEYGFIIRYPEYGKKSTGIAYEPWHIRYVGYPHSMIIMDSKSTLEGYMNYIQPGKAYRYKDYLIYRSENDIIKIPEDYEELVISPDNQGGYIVTFLAK